MSLQLNLQFKLEHPKAVAPRFVREGDAAMDLTVAEEQVLGWDEHQCTIEYNTGVAFAIPAGHVGILAARSSLSNTEAFFPAGIGVIDPNYRGTVRIRLRYKGKKPYSVGDRCCQLLIIPTTQVTLTETEGELDDTNRGREGFGSSGT